ncbi:hypothetical protein V1264_019127 [Littorina saxatilis]|uniref:Uncharacterized protein n=2 Tax=Littorina saxatilis TaxID=31220 RepID=A0AAN9GF21_9CAEN
MVCSQHVDDVQLSTSSQVSVHNDSSGCGMNYYFDGHCYNDPQRKAWSLPTSLLLTNILKQVKWKYVIVVFDDEHEAELPALTNHLSQGGVYYMLFHYKNLTLPGRLDTLFLTGSDSWLQRLRLLLFCSIPHSALVLHQADLFQKAQKMRSALSMTSQWLILDDPDVNEALYQSHISMTNVATVNCRPGNTCCEHAPVASSRCGQVMTLLWDGNNGSVSCVGTVDDVTSDRREIFPGRMWGFNRRLLSVSTLPWVGFVEVTDTGGVQHFSGVCIDLLEELAAQLNFTYKISQPADGIWGIEYENGTWVGLIGQLANSKVDLVVAPLTVTQQREQAMDFTYPFFNDADTVIYKKPDPKKDKWRTYLQPLKWQVLLLICVSLLATSLLLGFLESWSPFYPGNRLSEHRGHHTSYFRSFRLLYGALLAQADDDLPRSHSGRVLVSCWWIFSIVVAATYSGNLIAFLTVDKSSPLFVTLQDLLDQGTYKWGFMGGSAIHQTVKASNSILYNQLWSNVQKWSADDPSFLTTDVNLHYARLLEGEYAFVSDRATFERWKATRCDLELGRESFLPTDYGVGLPNDSAFVRVFSEKILMMHENGLLEKLRERWWPDNNDKCEPYTTTRATEITVVDTQSAFYLLLLGATVGMLALLLEYALTLSAWTRLKKCVARQKST